MKADIQQLAAMVGIISKSAEGMKGVISIDIYNRNRTKIHLESEVFLSNFDSYEKKTFIEDKDLVFVVIDGVEILALVDKEGEQIGTND